MDRLGRRQVAANATSRDQWEAFADHRRCLTAALGREGMGRGSRLCVLGAGNANDLDLKALLSVHYEVHLVDIDSEALSSGAQRQGVAKHPRLRLHGGVDVTATLGFMSDWTPMQLGRNGKHYRGVHPRQLLSTLRGDSTLRPLIAGATELMPWRWRLHDRTYLVGAISFRCAPRQASVSVR
jgi:hypothetical protein